MNKGISSLLSLILLMGGFLFSCKSKKSNVLPQPEMFFLEGVGRPYHATGGKARGVNFQIRIVQPQGIDLSFLSSDILRIGETRIPLKIHSTDTAYYFTANYMVNQPEPQPGMENQKWNWDDFPVLLMKTGDEGVIYFKYKEIDYQLTIPFEIQNELYE